MTALRIAAGVHAREFGDEIVVVDVRRGVYFSLNAVGNVIWKALAAGASIAAAIDVVVAAFDVDAEVARADTERLVAQLREARLLIDEGVGP
jgi:hypothetical protein